MEINDDVVLVAILQRGGVFPVTAKDLVEGSQRELIFRATRDVFVPPDALEMVQRSIDRLEAAGFLAESCGTPGRRITATGLEHLSKIASVAQ